MCVYPRTELYTDPITGRSVLEPSHQFQLPQKNTPVKNVLDPTRGVRNRPNTHPPTPPPGNEKKSRPTWKKHVTVLKKVKIGLYRFFECVESNPPTGFLRARGKEFI